MKENIQKVKAKTKPKRKNVFVRFEKFWKYSKFDFKSRNGWVKKFGIKKFKILLVFIFLIIDQKNMKFENDLGLPTNLEIANLLNVTSLELNKLNQNFLGQNLF